MIMDLSHHPDHDVGEEGNPQGGGGEGQHEPVVPGRRGAVGDGEVEQQRQRPGNQPLQLIPQTSCEAHRTKFNQQRQENCHSFLQCRPFRIWKHGNRGETSHGSS